MSGSPYLTDVRERHILCYTARFNCPYRTQEHPPPTHTHAHWLWAFYTVRGAYIIELQLPVLKKNTGLFWAHDKWPFDMSHWLINYARRWFSVGKSHFMCKHCFIFMEAADITEADYAPLSSLGWEPDSLLTLHSQKNWKQHMMTFEFCSWMNHTVHKPNRVTPEAPLPCGPSKHLPGAVNSEGTYKSNQYLGVKRSM